MAPKRKGRPSNKKAETVEEAKVEEQASEQNENVTTNGKDADNEPASKKQKTESKKVMNKTESNLDDINYDCEKLDADGKKPNLKICSWNVSGIRAIMKKNGLDYLKREDADIIALQETKCDTKKIPDEAKLEGYKHYFLESDKSGYCGVAVYSKEKPLSVSYGLGNSDFDHEGRLITAEYENFYLINAYVPNAGAKLVTLDKRLKWNDVFKKYIKDLDEKKPVILCGDMNVAHEEIDLTNPKTNQKNAGFTPQEREGMTEFLKEGFVDAFRQLYPDRVGAYTFWSFMNNARSKNIGWRLDYFLVSEKIKNKVCDVVNRDQVYGSDHCPVIFYESGYHETSTLAENSELNSMYEKVKTYLDVNERLRGASASLCQSDEQLQSSVQSVMKLTEEIKIQAQAALKQ
ncbi:hypothetical protein QAD02_016245 [Eretmocerus hayati]|uniref:Uncharacterized protein n=1 Tax=Eretmocerus hayati TaxID=131215 RepID=A0ACC2PBI4_9HYME|nr:hypothetical protein QAD02_016245 [Eretmocerus hayati]